LHRFVKIETRPPKTFFMRRAFLLFAIVLTAVVATLVACTGGSDNTTKAIGEISRDSLIKRGDYLVTTMGCDDCHSPKTPNHEVDMNLRLSGHPASMSLPAGDTSLFRQGWVLLSMGTTAAFGPWGNSYAANLTSDSTGIGMWTEEQFFRAIRKGLYKGLEGSRPLMPPMPWMQYKHLSDHDLRAIFAFLKSTKPVKNAVPAWKPLNNPNL
jgi:hypothetical protein